MPARGIERVAKAYRFMIEDTTGTKTHDAMYAILSAGAAEAGRMTPQDTGNLLQSQYAPQITHGKDGSKGYVGYTARYAKWVHDMPGTLKGKPRADFGVTSNRSAAGPQKPTPFGGGTQTGTYWAPNAEPMFLTKGFAAIRKDIPAMLKRFYGV